MSDIRYFFKSPEITPEKHNFIVEGYSCTKPAKFTNGKMDIVSSLKYSEIGIEYDSKLINFISTIREEYYVSHFETEDFLLLQQYQEELIDVFIYHQNLLTFIDSKKRLNHTSYENNFALMIAFISDLQICNSWNDLLEQAIYSIQFHDYDFSKNNNKFKCCCQHACLPENQYLITNQHTHLSLSVGCDCIKKYQLVAKENIKELQDSRKNNSSYKYKMEEKEKQRQLEIQKLKQLQKEKEFEEFKLEQEKLSIPRKIISHWNKLIQKRKRCRRKLIYFIIQKIHDRIDFPKVKNVFGNISYFRFIFNYGQSYKWKKYIEWLLDPKNNISYIKVKKIQEIIRFKKLLNY